MGKQEKLFSQDKEKARLDEISHKNACELAAHLKTIEAEQKFFKVFNDYVKLIREDKELLRDNLRAAVESGTRLLNALKIAATAAEEVYECDIKLAQLASGVSFIARGATPPRRDVDDIDDDAIDGDIQDVEEETAEELLALPETIDSPEVFDGDANESAEEDAINGTE